VYVIDLATDRVIWKNHGAERILGVPPGSISLETPWLTPVHPDDRELVLACVDRVRQPDTAAPVSSEHRLRHADGSWRWVEGLYLPLHQDDDGAVTQALVTLQDVTEARAMRAQLAQAGRLASVGTLASGVAHEVNNPLTYVLFNLAHLKRELEYHAIDTPWAGGLVECAADAITGANKVRDIVWDIKAFSAVRMDTVEPVDVNRSVQHALTMANNQLRHRARLDIQLGEIGWLLGSPGRLNQAFLNLVLNAVQAIPEDDGQQHVISVTSFEENHAVHVTIRDDGVGIPQADQERLFDPFFTTRDHEGSGLGLSICHSIVSSFGGRIWLESAPGAGTAAHVVLPLPREDADSDFFDEPTSQSGLTTHRVLVIDDDKLLTKALARACEGRFDLTVLNSGARAVELLRQDQQWDLVLCDLMMPGMSGMDLYDWVRRRHPELVHRVAFMTGGAFSPKAQRLLESTTNPVLDKPFTVSAFPSLLAGLVRRANHPG